jgi:uncharacterized protein (TIGR03083 family)
MTTTRIAVADIPVLDRHDAAVIAAAENQRFVDLARTLRAGDWTQPTDCPAWNVQELTAHVLGSMEFTASMREFVHQQRAGKKAAGDRPQIDGMTEVQVRERSHLGADLLVERLVAMAPRGARARRRLPAPFRRLPMKVEVAKVMETWRLGYLFDVILTRDTWMHRVDVSRATGREPVLTADHDGRLVADVVAEWARRHGQPFALTLEGPAGGTFTSDGAGTGTSRVDAEEISLDAVEFCRILSGRASGAGLLTQEVPF